MKRIPDVSAFGGVLDVAMSVDRAVCGDVQKYDRGDNTLKLLVWRGYDDGAVAHFLVVAVDDTTPCAQALIEGRRVIIRDIDDDPGYEPHREVVRRCGVRAIQATPLRTLAGVRIGVLSTHFPKPHHPSTASARRLDRCCATAALLLECMVGRDAIQAAGQSLTLTQRAASAADLLPALLARFNGRYDADLLDATSLELTHIARQLAAHA